MKKFILLFLTTICLSFNVFAQSNCLTFLGIPIDGTKAEMISKLEAKGYEYNSYADCLVGEFNGKDAIIYVNTIHNKVWRIIVVDKTYINETDIKYDIMVKEKGTTRKSVADTDKCEELKKEIEGLKMLYTAYSDGIL